MNAHARIQTDVKPSHSDAELLAFDAVFEFGGIMCAEAALLVASAGAGDLSETEARLWNMRRILKAATASWREAVPAPSNEGGGR